jgi:hypothetical protein
MQLQRIHLDYSKLLLLLLLLLLILLFDQLKGQDGVVLLVLQVH